LMLCFSASEEPWRGVLVCTDRAHHAALTAEFPELTAHPILPKWLYLPEAADSFERTAAQLVSLARRRDPRIGITAKPKKSPVAPSFRCRIPDHDAPMLRCCRWFSLMAKSRPRHDGDIAHRLR
jgi:hypothetical protein